MHPINLLAWLYRIVNACPKLPHMVLPHCRDMAQTSPLCHSMDLAHCRGVAQNNPLHRAGVAWPSHPVPYSEHTRRLDVERKEERWRNPRPELRVRGLRTAYMVFRQHRVWHQNRFYGR